MKPIEIAESMVTVVAEPGALSFVTRKEWQPLPEKMLDNLTNYEIIRAFKGTSSVFLLLRVLALYEGTGSVYSAYKLVRITVDDETGKQIFFYMNLSPAEADQLKDYRLTLWD